MRCAANGASQHHPKLRGLGLPHDTPDAAFFSLTRFLWLADGPDELQLSRSWKLRIAEYVKQNLSLSAHQHPLPVHEKREMEGAR